MKDKRAWKRAWMRKHYRPSKRKPKNVYWRKDCQMWRVAFGIDGKQYHCGHFYTLKEATAAAKRFRIILQVKKPGPARIEDQKNDLQS